MIQQPGPSSNLKRLTRLLRAPQVTIPADFCGYCQSELPIFVSDELAGQPVDQYSLDIANHLDVCPICLGEYVVLAELADNALLGKEVI